MPQIQKMVQHGEGGYAMYRVPGLIVTKRGTLLVYYEGRQEDLQRRTLLCRRSEDGGKTFAPQQILKDSENSRMVHNPLMLTAPDGRILFFWMEDYKRLFVQESFDDGKSFGSCRELTCLVEQWKPEYPWNVFAVAPGHAICTQNGQLVVPLWMSRGGNAHRPACFACLYSDNNGLIWQRGDIVDGSPEITDPTEASVTECSDGTLLATMRHGTLGVRQRAFVRGTADCWQKAQLNPDLPDPVCAGALARLEDGRLLFSNCAYGDAPAVELEKSGDTIRWSRDARQNLTLRFSEDDGVTWSGGVLIEQQAGYSDLAVSVDQQMIFCFFESGWIDGDCIYNESLALARIAVEELN